MSYETDLEKQNEELKDHAAALELRYKPEWRHHNETIWVYETPFVTFAIARRFKSNKGDLVWQNTFFGGSIESQCFYTADIAKSHVEQRIWENKFFRTELK
jgi:hypothetical protein